LNEFVEFFVLAVEAHKSRGICRQLWRHELVVHILVPNPDGLEFLYKIHARR
jgi:hypothetical protein